MYRIVLLSFLLGLISESCHPQNSTDQNLIAENYSSYFGSGIGSSFKIRPNVKSEYDSLIQEALNIVGLPNTDITVAVTRNYGAFAAIKKDCKGRYLLYNIDFFNKVKEVTKSEKAIMSICFHEISHHLNRHSLRRDQKSRFQEKEADRYSGYKMRLIKAPIEEAIAAVSYFGDEFTTRTHPSRSTRINQIKSGYYQADQAFFGGLLIKESDSVQDPLDIISFQEKASDMKQFEFEFYGLNKGITDIPLYDLLGELVFFDDQGRIISIDENEVIGETVEPFEGAPYSLLKVLGATYILEQDTIYSKPQNGFRLKLGAKLN